MSWLEALLRVKHKVIDSAAMHAHRRECLILNWWWEDLANPLWLAAIITVKITVSWQFLLQNNIIMPIIYFTVPPGELHLIKWKKKKHFLPPSTFSHSNYNRLLVTSKVWLCVEFEVQRRNQLPWKMKLPHRTAQQLKAVMCHSWRAGTRASKTQQTTAQVLKNTLIQLSLIRESEQSSGRFTVEFD